MKHIKFHNRLAYLVIFVIAGLVVGLSVYSMISVRTAFTTVGKFPDRSLLPELGVILGAILVVALAAYWRILKWLAVLCGFWAVIFSGVILNVLFNFHEAIGLFISFVGGFLLIGLFMTIKKSQIQRIIDEANKLLKSEREKDAFELLKEFFERTTGINLVSADVSILFQRTIEFYLKTERKDIALNLIRTVYQKGEFEIHLPSDFCQKLQEEEAAKFFGEIKEFIETKTVQNKKLSAIFRHTVEFYLETGKHDMALNLVKRAHEKGEFAIQLPSEVEQKLKEAEQQQQKIEGTEAGKKLIEKLLIEQEGSTAMLYLGPGLAAFGQGNFQKAMQHFEEGLAENPKHPDLLLWKGMVYFQETRYQKAIATFRETLQIDPDNQQAKEMLACRELLTYSWEQIENAAKRGDHKHAQKILDNLIDLDLTKEAKATLYFLRGIVLYETGETDKAVAELNQALMLEPGHEQAQKMLKTIQDSQKSKTTTTDSDRIKELLVKVQDCQNRGDNDGAIRYLNQAIALKPKESILSVCYTVRGGVYFMRGQRKEGINDLEKAVEIDPNNETAKRNLFVCKRSEPLEEGRKKELVYIFICSGNPSLINAFYKQIIGPHRSGMYMARQEKLRESIDALEQYEEQGVKFDGSKWVGKEEKVISDMCDVLKTFEVHSYGSSHTVNICFAIIESGELQPVISWYNSAYEDAQQQGIMPFPMFITQRVEASQYILDRLKIVESPFSGKALKDISS